MGHSAGNIDGAKPSPGFTVWHEDLEIGGRPARVIVYRHQQGMDAHVTIKGGTAAPPGDELMVAVRYAAGGADLECRSSGPGHECWHAQYHADLTPEDR